MSIEKKVYSQHGEDGVLEYIFHVIGTTNKKYVEVGTESGVECNTRNLMLHHGWSGLLLDGSNENFDINLHKEFITAENVCVILEKYNAPEYLDLLSLDIDFNDWYVLREILKRYKPNAIVVECNAKWGHEEDKVVQYNPTQMWDGTDYFGASVKAFVNLCETYGYSFVYMDESGTNMFFIENKKAKIFRNANKVKELFKRPTYGNGGHPDDPLKREYLTSVELLKNNTWFSHTQAD